MSIATYRYVLQASNRSLRCFCTNLAPEMSMSNEAVKSRRNRLFEEERTRQLHLITRIEKIQVTVKGPTEMETLLIMNKDLSTPHNCAMHISEHVRDLAALALVNGRPWDLHRPLVEDCELQFLHFLEDDPRLVNKAYWRTCCFLSGLLAETAFKDSLYVELHSWPSPNVRSGSFVYDVDLKMPGWKPSKEELRAMSMLIRKLCAKNVDFERLEVDVDVALNVFNENRFKREQIPAIAASSPGGRSVVLYRVGDHVDVSRGPMVARTGLVGRYDVTAVYPLVTDYGTLHRFQGVSLPRQIRVNHFIWKILLERATKVNPSTIPRKPTEDVPSETPLHQSNDIEPSV